MIGGFEDFALRVGHQCQHFLGPVVGHVGEVPGREAKERGAAVVVGRPGQGAVGGGLGEDDTVAGLAGDRLDEFAVLFAAPERHGAGIVALMAARDQAEATVALVDIGELVGGDGQAIVHLLVLEDIVLVAVEAGAGRAVQKMALGAFAHGDDPEIVVEAEAGAQDLVQIGHYLGVDEHVAERSAEGILPGEGAAEVAASGGTGERPGASRERERADAFADLVRMAVDGLVGQGDVRCR